MFGKTLIASLVLTGSMVSIANAQDFRLSSTSVSEGAQLSKSQVFEGFGCTGGNTSPQLSWSTAPKGTKSFAITAYDPDAPTNSGWWHWNAVNIPASVHSIELGASGKGTMPKGTVETANDYGTLGFGGACPPAGQVHRYVFTVYALSTEKMDIPKNASNALVSYMTHANTIESAKITAVYSH